MAQSFVAINKCLGEYYRSVLDDTYYSDAGRIGKFLLYCNQHELEVS